MRPSILPCTSDITPLGLYMVGDSIGVEAAVMENAPRPKVFIASSYKRFITRGWMVDLHVPEVCTCIAPVSGSGEVYPIMILKIYLSGGFSFWKL